MCNRITFFLVAAAVFLADQFSKYWLIAVFDITHRTPVALWPYFSLVMTWNRGVSFSMFASGAEWMPWVLLMVAAVISTLLIRLGLRTPHCAERIAYAMVVGGALGNAFDRLRFGAVADFFYAHVGDLGFPAFNVADSAICVGVGLLLLTLVKKPSTP